MNSALDQFERFSFEFDAVTRDVFRAGTGPGIIVMHEVPGLYPQDIALGMRLVKEGFTV